MHTRPVNNAILLGHSKETDRSSIGYPGVTCIRMSDLVKNLVDRGSRLYLSVLVDAHFMRYLFSCDLVDRCFVASQQTIPRNNTKEANPHEIDNRKA